MQSDDFYDLINERYLSDNGDNDVPIIDLTNDDNFEVNTQLIIKYNLFQLKQRYILRYLIDIFIYWNETVDFNQNYVIHLLTECLKVNEIQHTIFPMEYPPTSSEGIAICYNVENWDSYESAFKNVSNFIFIN
jgi:hypothetical protein